MLFFLIIVAKKNHNGYFTHIKSLSRKAECTPEVVHVPLQHRVVVTQTQHAESCVECVFQHPIILIVPVWVCVFCPIAFCEMRFNHMAEAKE